MIFFTPAILKARCKPKTPSLPLMSPKPVSQALITTNWQELKSKLDISLAVKMPSSFVMFSVGLPQYLLAPANSSPERIIGSSAVLKILDLLSDNKSSFGSSCFGSGKKKP